MAAIRDHPVAGAQITDPTSISARGAGVLYMHGPLEVNYSGNLEKTVQELLDIEISTDSCVMLMVNDRKLREPLKVRLVFSGMQLDS